MPPLIEPEPTIAEGLAAGADVVLCSGDKLLGGPQCGLIVGTKAAVERIASDPLMRAFRVDKMTLAALEATLRLALDPATATRRIPLWSFLTTPLSDLRARADRLAEAFRADGGLNASVIETTAYMGGGSHPERPIPSVAVRLEGPFPDPIGGESALAKALRLGDPPVVARIQGGGLLLDLRALQPSDDVLLQRSISHIVINHH